MRVYISADIEGVAGISSWDEADPSKPGYAKFCEQMTLEVKAACEGSIAAGASEILVNDAHWNGRNIDVRKLPKCVKILRGWAGHPFCMMEELDSNFDAVLFVGYHSKAGSNGNPLAHTLSGSTVNELRINNELASEFLINTYTATYLGVPISFLSGDERLCQEVKNYDEKISTIATQKGIGLATLSIHPDLAIERIRDTVCASLKRDLKAQMRPLPKNFICEIDFKTAVQAYPKSFYPGAELASERKVAYKNNDYFEILRFLQFTT